MGPQQRDRSSNTAGWAMRGPMARSSAGGAGEQAADAVGDAGGLTGQVVVEADEHVQLRQGLVAEVDRAQGVRRAASASAMTKALRASVSARPGERSAIRRMARPGR
ncbi:hypothetical protein GCM10010428_50800 [Actinosynnema pretiosum subsp. pretiosum]